MSSHAGPVRLPRFRRWALSRAVVVPDEELSESQRRELEDERAFRRSVKNVVASEDEGPYTCPCCGDRTLPSRGQFDWCPECCVRSRCHSLGHSPGCHGPHQRRLRGDAAGVGHETPVSDQVSDNGNRTQRDIGTWSRMPGGRQDHQATPVRGTSGRSGRPSIYSPVDVGHGWTAQGPRPRPSASDLCPE